MQLGPWVPQIPLQVAMQHLLPPINHHKVAKTRKIMERNGKLLCDTMISTGLDGIFKQIIDGCGLASEQGSPTLEFVLTENRLDSFVRGESSRPFGFGQLVGDHPISTLSVSGKDSSSLNDWLDIAFVVEFESQSSVEDRALRDENSSKMLWSMAQIMLRDPRRRFVFGMMFEQSHVRLWYYNRSVTLVVEPFDWLEDPESLIHVTISLFYASVLDLGWDPTIKLGWDNDTFNYSMILHHCNQRGGMVETTYRITEELSYSGIGVQDGPGTRVFEPYPIDSLGNRLGDNVAVKDRWIRDDIKSEDEILFDILKHISNEEKRYFLTLIAWGDVLINGLTDHTEDTIMRGLKLGVEVDKLKDSTVIQNKFYLDYQLEDEDRIPPSPRRHHWHPVFRGKTHRRTVYKEIGSPFKKINDMPTIVQCLIDTVKALEILHRVGYVHRDVSPGNILVVQSRGVLIDMEYATTRHSLDPAEDYDGLVQPIQLIGTLDFMSFEVRYGRFMFLPRELPISEIGFPTFPNKIPFVYNPLHDIESVWWILLWVALWKGLHISQEEMSKKYSTVEKEAYKKWCQASTVFSNSMNNHDHDSNFSIPHAVLRPLSDISLKSIRHRIAWGTHVLHSAYEEAEKLVLEGQLDPDGVFSQIHERFTAVLQSILNDSRDIGMLCSIHELYFRARHLREMQESSSQTEKAPGSKEG